MGVIYVSVCAVALIQSTPVMDRRKDSQTDRQTESGVT